MPTPFNVLIITTGAHRADLLGRAYTPCLDQLAGEGVRFERAYCTTPLDWASRTTLLTGQLARGVAPVHVDEAAVSLAQLLRQQGYDLALSGKNGVFAEDYLRSWSLRELFDLYGKEQRDFCVPLLPHEGEVSDWRREIVSCPEIALHEPQPSSPNGDPTLVQTNFAVRYLAQCDRNRPFFMLFSFCAPHFPYMLPEPFFSRMDPATIPGPEDAAGLPGWMHSTPMNGWRAGGLTPAAFQRARASYLGMLTMVDQQVGRMVSALKRFGYWDRTIILFTADHGEFWGRRGLIGATGALYEDLLRVPLIWRIPGIAGGRRIRALVDHSDVLPTILDLLGLPRPPSLHGRSYAGALAGGLDARHSWIAAESSPASSGRLRSMYRERDGLKLITHGSEPPELYDLRADPVERLNLAESAEFAPVLADLQARLDTLLPVLPGGDQAKGS